MRVPRPFDPEEVEKPQGEESKKNIEREEKPIANENQQQSEDFHGGSESTESLPDSPNEGSEEQEKQQNGQSQSSDQPSESDNQQSQSPSENQSQQSTSNESSTSDTSEQASSEAESSESSNSQQFQSSNGAQSQQSNTDESSTSDTSETSDEQSSSDGKQGESQLGKTEGDNSSQSSSKTQQSEQPSQSSDSEESVDNEQEASDSTSQESDGETDGDSSNISDSSNDVGDSNEQDNKAFDSEEEQEQVNDSNEENEEQMNSGTYNTNQVFTYTSERNNSKLTRTLYDFIEYIADETRVFNNLSADYYDPKKLMLRRYQGKSLNATKSGKVRETIVVLLDNSGSMDWVREHVLETARALIQRHDAEIYFTPNGYIETQLTKQGEEQVKHENVIDKIVSQQIKVLYLGDYDGANTPIGLSWKTKVFWLCPESRYRRFRGHRWVHYDESAFRGFFARTYDAKEMVQALKRFSGFAQFARYWHDPHEREVFHDD